MSLDVRGGKRRAPGSASSLVSADVRAHNLGIVARYLAENGPSSRSQIAEGSGLTRGAVTVLASSLIEAAVVREAQPKYKAGKGRPIVPLELASDDVALLVLQLDADKATALLSSVAGDVLLRIAEPHGRPMGRPELILDVLAATLDRALEASREMGRRVAELTIVAFAPVGGDPVQVIADTDLGWGHVDVIGGLRARVQGFPEAVRLVGDVHVAAVAEQGFNPGIKDLCYVKSNSGIGGALIVDGKLVRGGFGLAGALGHLPVRPGGIVCECGQIGCLVTVAGPDAVLIAAGMGEELHRDGLTSALAEFSRRVLVGEPAATAVWDEARVWIARSLQLVAVTLDPQLIVLGGYWSLLSESIGQSFAEQRKGFFATGAGSAVRVVPGRLGDDAALLGALWQARDRYFSGPLEIKT
ncbi:ROK family protein [Pseudarthrobacter psychrotolerans]|uniref:ROK family protein n=1 Tax=Pseudarthrobacter psychrotolerans TaxID=2697569 RepID=A0A6P1NJ63_9MICC|nr:ROK family protein [Pseudarthrobacter psychrotolerans]QHK18500.1 ROK family protein [Pseudarthrobacter psychrotolerans]